MARRPRRRVVVVTGTRAEFGLLRPVMDAVKARKDLELVVVAGGAHLLPPARTIREVESAYRVAAKVPMQRAGTTGRLADAEALGRGVQGFARAFAKLSPDWVVVLGDRIEAFAAASAASVAGIAVCHLHGGDRAEGIADEAMRHAISKLAHLHAAASEQSRERLIRMGEKPEHVFNVGSPAIDGLAEVMPLSDDAYAAIGEPTTVILYHPSGLGPARDRAAIEAIMYGAEIMSTGNILCLAPNFDPGREVIADRLKARCAVGREYVTWPFKGPVATMRILRRPRRVDPVREGPEKHWRYIEHLPRAVFLSLLKRIGGDQYTGVLIGNSSAGMIEAQAVPIAVVNVGPRQDGRERGDTVVDVPESDLGIIGTQVDWALSLDLSGEPDPLVHAFGTGQAGPKTAELLAGIDPQDPALLRKRNAY
jgi:UDP-hydrolysing UDP-N-acetyl-D-glucosamine 2-epimerase